MVNTRRWTGSSRMRGNKIDGEYSYGSVCSLGGIQLMLGADPGTGNPAVYPPPIKSYGMSISHNTMHGSRLPAESKQRRRGKTACEVQTRESAVTGLLIAVTFLGITPENVGDNNDGSSERAATTAAWNRVTRSQVLDNRL